MGVTTTFIPQEINLDDQVDKTFIDYKTVGTNKKITLGKKSINSLALLDLRATILEVDASITGATENFSDIFSDANGLLNTVSTGDTTAIYDATNENYYNGYEYTGTTQTYSNTQPTENTLTSSFYFESLKEMLFVSLKFKAAATRTGTIQISKNGVVVETIPSATYTDGVEYTLTLTNPLYLEIGDGVKLNSVGGSLFSIIVASPGYSENPYITGNVANFTLTKNVDGTDHVFTFEDDLIKVYYEKEIYLTYDKANPHSFYGALYSGSTDSEDIGDVDIELYDATDTLLATFTPFTLYTDLSFATDPTYIILRQNDTESSKISKFVFLIE